MRHLLGGAARGFVQGYLMVSPKTQETPVIHETFRRVKAIINALGLYRKAHKQQHSEGAILAVYYWSVVNHKPVSWATHPRNWPKGLWRGKLPTQSCMSRRMALASCSKALARIEQVVRASGEPTLVAIIDGKALEISLHTADPDARVGRGTGHVAAGYKLHAIISSSGHLLAWRVEPLNVDERVVAQELVESLRGNCYLVGDSNYNHEPLYQKCASLGMQLVAPRQRRHEFAGHRPEACAQRVRSIDLLEWNRSSFGDGLMATRMNIERFFAQLSHSLGTIAHLPMWVRRRKRVQQWITARLTLAHLKGSIPGSKYSIRAA